MLEQYRKTFFGVQAVICLVTLWAYFACNRLVTAAAVFFAVMQVGAVLGALWATHLKRRMQGRAW